jgi:hypothetical protein
MSSTQELFQSLRTAFGADAGPPWLPILAVMAVLAGVAVVAGRAWSRRSARRQMLADANQAGTDKGLGAADVTFAIDLGDRAGIAPVDVMMQLSAFERASARELALQATNPHPRREASATRIAKLRRALGFDVLPPDHWMSTTRELKPGDALHAGAIVLDVITVTESEITLEFNAAHVKTLGPGPWELELIRPHDARYTVRCRVINAFAAEEPGRHRVILGHDEDPRRVQQREYVRVRVSRPMSYVALDAADVPPRPVAGQIVDISAGGMAFQAARPQPLGALHRCSFDIGDGMAFKDLATRVIDSVPMRGGQGHHVRVAFTALSRADRDRLSAAVAWHEQQSERARA